MKYSKTLHARTIKAYEETRCNVGDTCKAVNIYRDTFYDWLERYPDFKKDKEAADEALLDWSENQLFNLIKKGNTTASIFHLECKGKKRGWVRKNDDFKDISLQLMLMFNSFLQNRNLELANNVIEIQQEFIDMLLQSATPEHLEMLLKERDKNVKLLNGKN